MFSLMHATLDGQHMWLSDFTLLLLANATMMQFVFFMTQHGIIPCTLPDMSVVASMMLLELTNELNLGTFNRELDLQEMFQGLIQKGFLCINLEPQKLVQGSGLFSLPPSLITYPPTHSLTRVCSRTCFFSLASLHIQEHIWRSLSYVLLGLLACVLVLSEDGLIFISAKGTQVFHQGTEKYYVRYHVSKAISCYESSIEGDQY